MKMKILEFKITAVTVFTDRAQITRVAKINLSKGENKVAFDKLPKQIEEKSVQVTGRGNAILNDITFKKVFYSDYPEEKVKIIYDKIIELQKEDKKLLDDISIAENEGEFIENIASKLTSENEGGKSAPILDPEKWIKMVDFYRIKNEKLKKELREINNKRTDLQNKIANLQIEFKQYGANRDKTKNQVQISLENEEDAEITLELTYIVYQASWYPFYDLRASTSNKKMNISYNAMITQATGEDWNEVDIKISTAQVQISGKQPELSAWYLDIYKPPTERPMGGMEEMMKSRSPKKKSKRSMAKMDMSLNAMNIPEPEIQVKQAKVETGATSVLFDIQGTNTIKSDNNKHKVSITIKELPADFTYGTLPKKSQFAYLKTKSTNNTEFPFLAGETNIFLDGSFVANSRLNLVAPNEKFTTSLGVDEAIKVEYKLINKFEKDKGVFSKKANIVFEYQTVITNNKKSKEKIIIYDQLPVSQNDDIKVELLKPKYKEDNDNLKINKEKFIEWYYELEPAEKVEIDFSYSVESPQDIKVSGI